MAPKTIPSLLLRLPTTTSPAATICSQCRALHRLNAVPPRVPKPTPFVPDTATFLKLIGRSMSKHVDNIPSWEALFTLNSDELKTAGVEPARARRYLLWWRERFRNNVFGIGGDLKNVTNGVAELRIVQVPRKSATPDSAPATLTQDAGMTKVIVNPPPTAISVAPTPASETTDGEQQGEEQAATEKRSITQMLAPLMRMTAEEAAKLRIQGLKIVHSNAIAGTGVEPVKGHQGVARLQVREGLWEQRRGHKVDGGERRKAEVRSKRRATERKNA